MGNRRVKSTSRKRKFLGNRFTKKVKVADDQTCSEHKLDYLNNFSQENQYGFDGTLKGNKIFNLSILASVFSSLCCPNCFEKNICLYENSVFGLSSNMSIKCLNCNFIVPFATTEKLNKQSSINLQFVCGMRVIGRGHSSAKKLCATLNMPCMTKRTYRLCERKLLVASTSMAKDSMNEAALEVKNIKNCSNMPVMECGVSVDGTWQRRGHSSLNGCVAVLSINTGKLLDLEIMSKFCRICNRLKTSKSLVEHACTCNHLGSASSMESVGAYRIFERSCITRSLKYVDYYGDGDSQGYLAVKDVYGVDSVTKYECIGHIQKRVGSHLRKLKKSHKNLGGKGKLSDVMIDKIQNYYGIAIRSNTHNIDKMQSAVIAAFFHCCSSCQTPMHGQCPAGTDSWCSYQRAKATGRQYTEKSAGLPAKLINIVKPVYMKLCDKNLLQKCLHGKTQNANESFNGCLWQTVPKETFIELKTFSLGAYLAVIIFNKGFNGLLDVLKALGINAGYYTLRDYRSLDIIRVNDSKRHSLPDTKSARKKNRAQRKRKFNKTSKSEGVTYKSGKF